jgi:DNA-binding winged helix-turn-helix (wHTH) protein
LLARIEATLRRRVLSDQIEVRPAYVLDDLTINFAHRQVKIKDRPVSLSATEYKILYELASHAGMVLTHGQILQRVWGPEYSGENDLVRSFIRNVRRKLGDEARNPRYIFTEPQVGYRMARPKPRDPSAPFYGNGRTGRIAFTFLTLVGQGFTPIASSSTSIATFARGEFLDLDAGITRQRPGVHTHFTRAPVVFMFPLHGGIRVDWYQRHRTRPVQHRPVQKRKHQRKE